MHCIHCKVYSLHECIRCKVHWLQSVFTAKCIHCIHCKVYSLQSVHIHCKVYSLQSVHIHCKSGKPSCAACSGAATVCPAPSMWWHTFHSLKVQLIPGHFFNCPLLVVFVFFRNYSTILNLEGNIYSDYLEATLYLWNERDMYTCIHICFENYFNLFVTSHRYL